MGHYDCKVCGEYACVDPECRKPSKEARIQQLEKELEELKRKDPLDELVQLLAPVLTHGRGSEAIKREADFRRVMKELLNGKST